MISTTPKLRRAALVTGLILMAGLAGCGKQGRLERPAPLFGDKARAEYEAMKAQEARDEAQRRAQRGLPPNQPPPASTPRREILDPNQRNVPASEAPVQGAPNPFGNRVEAVPYR